MLKQLLVKILKQLKGMERKSRVSVEREERIE
jgi:hypothetical protein